MLDAAGVAVALWADKVIGVQDQFVKALIPVQVPEGEQRQLRLGSQEQTLFLVQFDTWQGGEMFGLQEQHAVFEQLLALVRRQAIENGQPAQHTLPDLWFNRVSGQGAAFAPVAERT